MQLELALQRLQGQTTADEVLFWGKINGLDKDYFIALTVTYNGNYEFPDKKFYFTTSANYTFAEMPDLNEQHRDAVDKMNDFFTGNPTTILINVEKPAGKHSLTIRRRRRRRRTTR
jgi:radial spoke head protein 9